MNVDNSAVLKQGVNAPPSSMNSRRSRRYVPDQDEPVRRQMCNKCPGCLHIKNISECSNEKIPLLLASISLVKTSKLWDKILVCLLMVALLFSAGIGTYLLILPTEGAIIEEFDYVSRENWGVNSTFLKDVPPLSTPVSNILLLELTPNCTGDGKNCLNYEEFSENDKAKIRIYSGDVLYNFYQDEAGKIFEGRGWNFQSECGNQEGCDDVLTIALIEKVDETPSPTQINKLKAFLDYTIMDNALKPCYQVLVGNSSTTGFDDIAFTLDDLNRKDSTCKLLV